MIPSPEHNNEKVAIITGASQGIGAGLTRAYRELGYIVIATARLIERSEDSGIVTIGGDIADPETAQGVVGEALERFGRIDTLINKTTLGSTSASLSRITPSRISTPWSPSTSLVSFTSRRARSDICWISAAGMWLMSRRRSLSRRIAVGQPRCPS
jgi:NAD(P)-dependent dehydrogenase (short-subunit alcohol dehydrogenase family)